MAGGYIIGEKATWYLASEEEYPALDDSILVNNKGEAEIKSDGTYHVTGFATGASFEAWEKTKSANTNPATTAVRNSVTNAIMGLFASKDFYLRLLGEGYIYFPNWDVDIVSVTSAKGIGAPQAWYDKVRSLVEGDTVNMSIFNPLLKGKPDIIAGAVYLDPGSHPSYGTDSKPYDDSDGDPPRGTQGNTFLPEWVQKSKWQSWYSKSTLVGGETRLVYRADFFIKPDLFKDFLLSQSIIIHEPNTATLILKNGIQEEKEFGSNTVEEIGGTTKKSSEFDENDLAAIAALLDVDVDKNVKIKDFLSGLSVTGSKYATALLKLHDSGDSALAGDDGTSTVGVGALGDAAIALQGLGAAATKNWSVFFKENLLQAAAADATIITDAAQPYGIQALYPNATHYVLTRGTTGTPPQPKTTIEVQKWPTKGKTSVGTLMNGDAVIVKKEFIGDNGEWHKIKVLQAGSELIHPKKTYYVNSKFLKKLPNTAPSLDRTHKCKNQKKFPFPDWTKMQHKEVFFDKGKCNQCIVIQPMNPLTGKNYFEITDADLEDIKQSALETGIVELLKFYNKHMVVEKDSEGDTNKTLEKILGAFEGPFVDRDDWYLDKRPLSKLKILVKFPSKYFDALAETPEDFRGIAHTSTATLELESSDEEVAFVKDIPSLRTVHFVLPTLKEKIQIISVLMESYAKKMDAWLGKIPGFDLRKEKKRLEDFSLALFKFLQLNGFTVDEKEEDTIELGFNKIFELQYVLINKTGFAAPLRIGFERFKNTDPINITRTMAYVFYLDDLMREARKKTKIGWIEFVQKYTFPIPEIKPSNVASAIDSICAGTMGEKKEFSEKIAKTYDQIETYTSKGMEESQKKLNSPTLKVELASIRKSATSFVGDEFTRQIPDLLAKMDSIPTNLDGINELYSSVLNKTDIKNLASLAASAEIGKMPSLDITTVLAEFALEDMVEDEVKELYDTFSADFKKKIDIRIEEIDLGIDIESAESVFSSNLGDINSIDIEKYKKPEASLFQKSIMENSEFDSKKLGLEEKYGKPANKIKTAITSLVDHASMSDVNQAASNLKEEGAKIVKDLTSEFLDGIELVVPGYKLKYKDFSIPGLNMPSIPDIPSMPDMPSLDLKSMEVPSLKLPSVPSFTIPDVGKDLMKRVDTMSDVGTDLKDQIEEVTCTILLETVKTTLEGVFDSLFSSAADMAEKAMDTGAEYGSKNLNSMFESAAGPFSLEGECGASKAFAELGIPTEVFLEAPDNDPGEEPASPGSVKTMIDDVSAVLTPLEVVDLLEGTAKPETIKAVEDVIAGGYPTYMSHLQETTNIVDAFNNLGRYIDPNLIDSIKKAARTYPRLGSGLLCEGDVREEEREVTALGVRVGLTRAREQIKRNRRRRRKKLKKLMSLSRNADNVLKDILPPVVDNCGDKVTNFSNIGDGTLNAVGGLIPKDHESIKYMNKKLVKNMFEIPNMHFNTEVNTYIDSLIKGEFIVPRKQDYEYKGFLSALVTAFKPKHKDYNLEDAEKAIGLYKTGGEDWEPGDENRSIFTEVLVDYQKLNLQVAPNVKTSFLNVDNFFKNEQRKVQMKMPYLAAATEFATVSELSSAKASMEKLGLAIDDLDASMKKIEDAAEAKKDKATSGSVKASINAATNKSRKKIEAKKEKLETDLNKSYTDYYDNLENLRDYDKATVKKDATMLFGNSATLDATAVATGLVNFAPQDDYHLNIDQSAAFSLVESFNALNIPKSGSLPAGAFLQEENNYSFLSPISSGDDKAPWTWQEESFANYMTRRWSESGVHGSDNTFAGFFKNKQMSIFAHLLGRLTSFVPDSPLFSTANLENLELATDENDPEESSDACPTPPRPGLLDIKKYQEVVNNAYDEACEGANKKPLTASAIEASGIQGIVYTTIRLYVLEILLKSIFTFSKFSFSETRGDSLITEIIAQRVMFSLRLQEEGYYDDFLKQAKVITDKRQQKGEKLFNPLSIHTDQSKEDETLSDPYDPRTISGISSLRFLIKEQIFLLSNEMEQRLNPPVKDIDTLFLGIDRLDSLIPTINVARQREQNRTETTIKDAPTFLTTSTAHAAFAKGNPDIHELHPDFAFLRSEAGCFVLEKYVRIEDRDELEIKNNPELTADPASNDWNFITEWWNRPGGIFNKFAQQPGFDLTNPDDIPVGSWGYAAPVYVDDATDELRIEFRHLSGVVNTAALREYLISKQAEHGSFDLRRVIKNLKFGLRLCYIPPEQGSSDAQAGDFHDIFKANEEPPDKGGNLLRSIAILEKAYWLPEHYQYTHGVAEQTYLSATTTGAGQTNLKEGEILKVVKETLTRTIYPIPIITIEDGTVLDSLPELTVNDVVGMLDPKVVAEVANGLKKEMVRTPKYQFLFDYIFPLPRMLSLISAYNVISISKNIPESENMFAMTKDSFRSMFYTLTPEDPWYSKQDKKHEAAGGNVGMMQRDNNSMTMTGPSSLPAAAKIAARAALILLKAQARRSDPHYSFVSKLDDLGAAPFGMTWGSVPPFWPANWWGWGPPLGPLGMVAYSAGLLPGEKKKKKKRAVKQGAAIGAECVGGEATTPAEEMTEEELAVFGAFLEENDL